MQKYSSKVKRKISLLKEKFCWGAQYNKSKKNFKKQELQKKENEYINLQGKYRRQILFVTFNGGQEE